MIPREVTREDTLIVVRECGGVVPAAERLGIRPGHIVTLTETDCPVPARLARRLRTCAILCGAPRCPEDDGAEYREAS